MEPINNTSAMSSAYAWDADAYANASHAQFRWAVDLMSKWTLRGNEHLLDLGCGDGKVSARFAQNLEHGFVTGIDASAGMIAYAKQHYRLKNLEFRQMDACNIHLPIAYDRVFSNAVMHWIKRPIRVLKGIKQHLNQRGEMLLQMGGEGNVAQLIDVMRSLMEHKYWSGYFNTFSPGHYFYGISEYREWIKQAGLREKRIELIPIVAEYSDEEAFKGWIRTTWLPYTMCVPDAKREAFIEHFSSSYIRQYLSTSDSTIHVKLVRLEVHAIH